MDITIAIVSDLHCHHSKKFKKDDQATSFSYLTTDLPRVPWKYHPVEALFELFKSEPDIKADYLLCPGDITNQVDVQGFITGWEYVREIAQKLQVKEESLIATLGNHDVDSRFNIYPDNVFKTAECIGRNFPFKNDSKTMEFWAKGYCFIEHEAVRLLVINSVKFHCNKEAAIKGKMDDAQIEGIDEYLKATKDEKIQIALCHHHPIEHARFNLGTEDTIEKGGELLEVLNYHKFDLLIHGHKHDPWLRYSQGNNDSLPIFSSGSFSATSNFMINSAKNTFHIIKITKEGKDQAMGTIKTWEYLPATGWRKADSGDHFFPQNTGFGFSGKIDDLIAKSIDIIENGNGAFLEWSKFVPQIQDVLYLTPDECVEFRDKLNDQGIVMFPALPKEPKMIGKPHV
ncbi:MAG: metallophosphoesterase [Chitinophagales bacterium]|nr:metallophosphoesterase [Chitinophagales bacterium]